MIETLAPYLPLDRYLSLIQNKPLVEHCSGSALFADISGFTPLTEALMNHFGPQHAAEMVTQYLNRVYEALIQQVHHYQGSVIGFVGDAITCWFEGDDGLRAAACGLALQETMQAIGEVAVDADEDEMITLAIKVGIATGPVRRFVVGDANIQQLDILVGAPLRLMAQAEQLAYKGEVIVAPGIRQNHPDKIEYQEQRLHPKTNDTFAVITAVKSPVSLSPWLLPQQETVSLETIKPWLLPSIYQRLQSEQRDFLAELRPAISLFLRFEGLDYDNDEAVGEKLDAYIRWVQQTVTYYGGNVIQLTIGDKGSFLYAAFGAPVTYGDDAERAISAALALRESPPNLAYITPQIGVAKGQARVGAYGSPTRRSYGVIGDDAVLAARLMGIAPAGHIRVAYSIYQTTQTRFVFNILPPVRVKGKAGLIRVYEPVNEQRGKTNAPFKPRGEVVARESEVAQLGASIETVQQGGHQVLFIEGEPGIGKTRLVEKLVHLVQNRGLTGLLGAGHNIQQQTPYLAWQDIFNSFFDLDEVVDLQTRKDLVKQRIREINPIWSTRLPLLNDILDLQFPETAVTRALAGELRQKSLHDLLVGLLRAWSAEQPLIIVLEDAHWLDSLSWELALYVAQTLPVSNSPFLLLIVTRLLDEHEQAKKQARLFHKLDYSQTLHLQTIPPEKTVAIAAQRLEIPVANIPSALAEVITNRTGGHPFFAEELVLMLLQRGAINLVPATADNPAQCSLSPTFDDILKTLPDTIQGLILARVDRLKADKQFILKVGSAIGRVFPLNVLHDILKHYLPLSRPILKNHLQDLDTFGLTPVETPEPNLTYRFQHSLIQEVMYETMLFSQRQRLHQQLAAWYENYYTFFNEEAVEVFEQKQRGGSIYNYTPNTLLPLLVHHYHHAKLYAKEKYYAQLAGEQATARFAHTEGLVFFNRVLELTPLDDYVTQYKILLKREVIYNLQGNREAQERDLLNLYQIATVMGNKPYQLEVLIRQAQYHYYTGNHQNCITIGQTAFILAKDISDSTKEAEICYWLGMSFNYSSNPNQASIWLQQGQNITQSQSSNSRRILRALGIIKAEQSDYNLAKKYFRKGLRLTRQLGDVVGESDNLSSLGVLSMEQGNIEMAQAYSEQALSIAQQIGYRFREGIVWLNLGIINNLQGRYSKALHCYQNALKISQDIQHYRNQLLCFTNLAAIYLELGYYVKAHIYAEQALELTEKNLNASINVLNCLLPLILTWHFKGNNHLAEKYALKAMEIAIELKSIWNQNWISIHFGYVLITQGQYQRAQDYYQQALDLGKATTQHIVYPNLLAGLAQVSLAQNNLAQALTYTETIITYLQNHDLKEKGLQSPGHIFWACYQVLKTAQDERAIQILERGYTLLQEMSLRLTTKDRYAFLNNEVVNCQLIAEYEKRIGHST